MLKFYPDHVPARAPRLAGDVLAALWNVTWAVLGFAVYSAVMALEVVSDAISGTGRDLNGLVGAFRNGVRVVPIISPWLQQQAAEMQRYSGDQLISTGAQAHDAIHSLALALGILTALPPIAIGGGAYLVWRLRDAREMGAALAFVRAAERSGGIEQARALLAYRAVASLSFARLMKVSADPVGDLAAHRYDGLADAMLRRAGLGADRLNGARRRRLLPGSGAAAPQVGDQGEQEHHDRRAAEHQIGPLRTPEQDRQPGSG